jgi:glyoxylase-like metal-dependent hydrolase (beta-lactamase superfamily II)
MDKDDGPAMDLLRVPVGAYQTNSYVLLCHAGYSLLVDPGDESGTLLAAIAGTTLTALLLTHGHPDHTGALTELRRVTGAPVAVHAADTAMLPITPDWILEDGQAVTVGPCQLQVHHLPGHTPGSIGLHLGGQRWLVGDAVFPGGPGHTDSPQAFATLMRTLQQRIFSLPDATELYPGHGLGTTVGRERAAFQRFVAQGWPEGTCGDVAWSVEPASVLNGS